MKVLGKKRHENIETIEAYDYLGCSGVAVCQCRGSRSYSDVNDSLYWYIALTPPGHV